MSLKDLLPELKTAMEKEDFDLGFKLTQIIVSSGEINKTVAFNVYAAHGLNALKLGKFDIAEEYLMKASELDAPVPASQKNLKVTLEYLSVISVIYIHIYCIFISLLIT